MTKIKNALPPPEQCDNCCSLNVAFIENKIIYGKPYGDWPYMYFCSDCRASVGCHEGTELPLGRMADAVTRKLRTKAHDEFDRLWRTGLMTRERAYNWLALQLGIEFSQCHISWLTKDQLKDVATLSADYLTQNFDALVKRKYKRHVKQQRRIEREDREESRLYTEGRRKRRRRQS